MNSLFQTIALWLATQLDKLKVWNPVVFLFLQAVLGTVLTLLLNDVWTIPTPAFIAKFLNLDELISGVLVALMALIAPRTSSFINAPVESAPESDPS